MDKNKGDKNTDEPTLDFMGKRLIAAWGSGTLIVLSIIMLAVNGLNFGLDFTSGTSVEVGFENAVDPSEVRAVLVAQGFIKGVVQSFGTDKDILIRMPEIEGRDQSTVGDEILAAIKTAYPDVEMRQSNFVGPTVGEELRENGGIAMLVALGVVMLYISLRFTGKFAVGAVVALVHDVIIVLGAFAVFRWTFDLPVLAAVLAVIGYSLNDTIVVSDRIRENFRRIRKSKPIEVINRSLNQTLGRTLITSMTTLIVLLALMFAGGELIRGFSIALTIGVVVGTYSSIYVAANMLLLLKISREDLMLPEKENSDEGVP